MADAAADKERKPLFHDSWQFMGVISVGILAVSAAGLGVTAPYYQNLHPIVAEWASALGDAGAVNTGMDAVSVAPAGAIIGLIAGLAGLAVALSKRARLCFLFGVLPFALIGGLIMLITGLMTLTSPVLDLLGPSTYVPNENLPDQILPPDRERMAYFSLAVFENCCISKGWNSQNFFGPCGTPCPSNSSGQTLDDRINQFSDVLDVSKLCTCIRDNATYAAVKAVITPEVCTEFKAIKVAFSDSLKIPTTSLSIGTIKSQLYGDTLVIASPLVGWNFAPEQDPTHETVAGYGFGCGLGYPKGIMWSFELFWEQNIVSVCTAATIIGGALLAWVIVTFLMAVYIQRQVDQDENTGQWQQTLAAKWNDPNDPRTSMKISPQNQPLAAYQVPAVSSSIAQQLGAFYAIHDRSKTADDIQSVAAWAETKGISALNDKLRAKYGVDLNSMNSSYSAGGPPI